MTHRLHKSLLIGGIFSLGEMPGYVVFGERGDHSSMDALRAKAPKNALQEAQRKVGFTLKH